jgi:dinuclear metal center YbgI/SA1388 family protein
MLIKQLSQHIEEVAPLELQEPWDNSGWQVFCGNKECTGTLVSLSVTVSVIESAKKNGCNLIISHHPVIFKELKTITPETLTGKIILNAIKEDISIYAAHTNLDKAKDGVSDILAKKLGLKDIRPLVPEKNYPEAGMGRTGSLNILTELYTFLDLVKKTLKTDHLKIINNCNKTTISKIAICGGAGASLTEIMPDDIDLFITGDVKYHDALEAQNIVLVDAGHLQTEQFIVDKIVDTLKILNLKVEGYYTNSPWQNY